MDEQPTRVYEPGEMTWSDVVGNGPAAPAVPPTAPAGRRGKSLASGVGLVLGGILLGTVATSAAQGLGGSHGTAATAAQTQGGAGLGAPNSGTVPQQGQDQAAQPGFGGRRGGLGGDQRLRGTVASVSGSSISVTTGSGTASYAVTAQTEIVKDGQPVALSSLSSGDAVFLQVYPAGSGMAAERIFAGSAPGGGPGSGGFGRDRDQSAPTGTTGRAT